MADNHRVLYYPRPKTTLFVVAVMIVSINIILVSFAAIWNMISSRKRHYNTKAGIL